RLRSCLRPGSSGESTAKKNSSMNMNAEIRAIRRLTFRSYPRGAQAAPGPAAADVRSCAQGCSADPVEGAGHRLLPLRVLPLANAPVHPRLPAPVLRPALAQLRLVPPEADGQAGREGRPESRRLDH